MKKQSQDLICYLNRAQQLKIEPNFYLSEPYLRLCGAKCWERDGWVWIEADKWCLFPPLPLIGEAFDFINPNFKMNI